MSNKLVVNIAGLHCKACEILSENRLNKINNVVGSKVNFRTGQAEIFYDNEQPDLSEIRRALKEIGYRLDENSPKQKAGAGPDTAWLSTGLLIIIVFLLIRQFNFFDLSGLISSEFSWPLALLVGLIAGVSTCLALVGGLTLGVAANYAKTNPDASPRQKFYPHLIFNAGRVIGFFLLGGLLGLLGSTIKVSPIINGFLTIFIGVIILILGLRLLDIFPSINKLDFSLPKIFGRKIKSDKPFLLGALTFFLPCGFTQAMQIYALASGSFFSGGLIMSLFALGTVPGLLGLGGLTSVLSGKKSKLFFQLSGAVVILFALINLNNGLNLVSVSAKAYPPKISDTATQSSAVNGTNGDFQIVRMTESNSGYAPQELTVKKGRPVRWIIEAKAPYSCASALLVPSLNIDKQLKPGENIIEFTPTISGNIPFSCSMGMYTGNIKVTD